jgi:hypothetical protein
MLRLIWKAAASVPVLHLAQSVGVVSGPKCAVEQGASVLVALAGVVGE